MRTGQVDPMRNILSMDDFFLKVPQLPAFSYLTHPPRIKLWGEPRETELLYEHDGEEKRGYRLTKAEKLAMTSEALDYFYASKDLFHELIVWLRFERQLVTGILEITRQRGRKGLSV